MRSESRRGPRRPGAQVIPTIGLLFAVDIKVAGSLSLAVSLPTMLVAFAPYSRDQSFLVLGANKRFLAFMATGSITGVVAGAPCSAWSRASSWHRCW